MKNFINYNNRGALARVECVCGAHAVLADFVWINMYARK